MCVYLCDNIFEENDKVDYRTHARKWEMVARHRIRQQLKGFSRLIHLRNVKNVGRKYSFQWHPSKIYANCRYWQSARKKVSVRLVGGLMI